MKRFLCRGNVYSIMLLKILMVLVFFSFSRILFYLFNLQHFGGLHNDELLRAFLAGVRFDIASVIILGAVFILMNSLPLRVRNSKGYRAAADLFLIIPAITGLGLNAIDSVYFRFTSKRMTADILTYVRTGEEDFMSLLPRFIIDFIWEFLAWVLLSALLVFLIRRLQVKDRSGNTGLRYYLMQSLYFLIAATMAIVGIRGGLQLRPFTIIDAGRYVDAQHVSLVLNTPFTIVKSYGHTGLQEKHYFTDELAMKQIYDPVHMPGGRNAQDTIRPYNVVVLIMESFGTEYIASLQAGEGMKGYTPNLDTIIGSALAFRAYANGKQSIEALPAIVAGIPSLSTRPYITSAYGGNNIMSLAGILGEMGYSTHFFHGGRNGTMGFESFVGIAGYDHYYGKDEYNNDDDFDGNWGIYDGPYFDYFREHLDGMKEPFMATFFSLSSHHPYVVPPQYDGKFDKGTLDIHESIMYTDHCLGKFFRKARNSDWFRNTLFVITADHTSLSDHELYQTREGIYAVPLLFYMPGKVRAELMDDVAQQADIMPSILGFLNYPGPYVSFGNDLFDSAGPRFAVNFLDGSYQLIKDGWSMQFDGDRVVGVSPLQLHGDLANENAPGEEELAGLEEFIKAYIQQYNKRLITNKLVYHE